MLIEEECPHTSRATVASVTFNTTKKTRARRRRRDATATGASVAARHLARPVAVTPMAFINPEEMIEEVQKRPGLWKSDVPVDRLEKLTLWKEVGAALYKDWDTINKATAYDRVLQLQKRWRSYKDAYNRELRRRRSNADHRVYVYFNRLKFLGGYHGLPEPPETRDELDDADVPEQNQDQQSDHEDREQKEATDPLTQKEKRKRKRPKSTKRRHRLSYDFNDTVQVDIPTFPLEVPPPAVEDDDSEKLFLLSFVPEMKKLHPNIKMWVRSQIANVMQEAVRSHFSNSMPNTGFVQEAKLTIKRQRLLTRFDFKSRNNCNGMYKELFLKW